MDIVVFILLLVGGDHCAFVDQSDAASLVVVNSAPVEVAAPLTEGTTICAHGRQPRASRPHPPRARIPVSTSLAELPR